MTWFDWIDDNYKLGMHDAVCGLEPYPPGLAYDPEYKRGRLQGEKYLDELPVDDAAPEADDALHGR